MKAHAIHLLALAALLLPGCARQAGVDIAAGKRTFESRCASCHQIGPYARAGFAPQLNGIVGRAAASTPDFKYSPAMQNARLVWTEENLRAFLHDPQQVVPGTSMRFWGLGDESQIASLVAYLRTLR
jgi:cytochrome c